MNRRSFLAGFGVVAAGAAAIVVAPQVAATGETAVHPDDFMHHGYRVKWSGFYDKPDQNVVCGRWHARHGTKDLQWVSTTLGQCYPSRDWEAVDMTLAPGWSITTGFSTDAERAAVKQRALDALMVKL